MKNLFTMLAIAVLALAILSFTDGENPTFIQGENGMGLFEIPTDVQTIIDNSCYGCHNSESSSTKGKMKLKFDKMPDMKTGKLIGKLSKISKSITKGKMPPEKTVKKHPEMALSSEDSKVIISWADGLVQKLSGE